MCVTCNCNLERVCFQVGPVILIPSLIFPSFVVFTRLLGLSSEGAAFLLYSFEAFHSVISRRGRNRNIFKGGHPF